MKHPLFNLLETVLSFIGELYSNPDAYLGNCNKEARDIFLNNYCSATQPLLFVLGSECINDALLKQIVDLIIFVFNQSQYVSTGGLFILHGLVVAVGERISPYIAVFKDYLVCAINKQNTDEMGVRLACGLVSDLGNHCQGVLT